MPKVHFVNDELVLDAEGGVSLAEAALDAEASLPFGCRSGTCGTCACFVVRGESYTDDMGFVEADTLAILGLAAPGRRLACQVILKEDEELEIAW